MSAEKMYLVGGDKYLVVCEWEGNPKVHLRQYFHPKDAPEKMYPTKKGVTLSPQEWEKLKLFIKEVDKALKELGGGAEAKSVKKDQIIITEPPEDPPKKMKRSHGDHHHHHRSSNSSSSGSTPGFTKQQREEASFAAATLQHLMDWFDHMELLEEEEEEPMEL